MIKLYGRRSSINVQKVLWCLGELGLEEGRDFERIDAGLHFGVTTTPEFLAMNPNGLVPTLVDGASVLWESNTIVRYLAASRGNEDLLPMEPAMRAGIEKWKEGQRGALWATLRVAFLGLTRTPENERNYESIGHSHRQAARLLGIVDTTLQKQPYLALDRFTVADIGVALAAQRWFMLAEKFPERVDAAVTLPTVQKWLATVTQRSGYVAAKIGE